MKTSKLIGWKQVYQFTIHQSLKTRSIQILTLILCIIALVSMPIAHIISDKNNESKDTSPIKKVIVLDDSGLQMIDFSVVGERDERYINTTFEYTNKDKNDLIEEIKSAEKDTILLHIMNNQGVYSLQVTKSNGGILSDNDISDLVEHITDAFNTARIASIGVNDEQLAIINTPITTDIEHISATTVDNADSDILSNDSSDNINEPEKEKTQLNEYYVVLALIVVVVMFFAMGGEAIASSIITEKSTRVIEYLITSIRPLAIIVGKVLAMLSVTILQFTAIGISLIVSGVISKLMFPEYDVIPEILKGVITPEFTANINFLSVLITILIFVGGFIFFGLLAGLTGATVSKIEELAEGIMVFNMFLILGAYLGIATAISNLSGSSGLLYVAALLPMSTMFVTPIYMFLGELNVLWGLGAVLILVVSLVLLSTFTANIYEALILHRGNRLKMKDLFKLSKQVKGDKTYE